MKLRTIKKLLYQKRIKNLLLTVSILFLLHNPIAGQSRHFVFNFSNTNVSAALLEVSQNTNIRIAFDNTTLETHSLSKSVNTDSIEELLSEILAETDYTFEFKHNTWLIKKRSADTVVKSSSHDILGVVFDNETLERLPYASVYLSSVNRIIPSTVDGTFSTQTKNREELKIEVRYLGYQTLDTVITVNNQDDKLLLGLTRQIQNLATIQITGEKLEMVELGKEAGHMTFNPAGFSDLPNYGETDVFRSLQLLPGISAREGSAQLNIRGSSADQNLVIFDGFTLYNLDHFFGVFSALNPNVIKNIQVYRGGFDSRYGERVSGIVDITGKSGNRTKPELYGGVNMISANVTTEIPVSPKITLVAAARRAYSDIYSSWLTDEILADKTGPANHFPGADNVIEPEFHFSDYNVKLNYAPNEFENISLTMYGAKDHLNSSNILERENFSINTVDINEWGNTGLGLSWNKHHNYKYYTNLTLGHSGYFNDYDNSASLEGSLGTAEDYVPSVFTSTQQATKEKNNLTDYFVSFDNVYNLNSTHLFEFGLSARHIEFEFYKDLSKSFIYSNLKQSAILSTLYFQDKITIKKNLVLKPGIRVNHYDITNKLYFEPRLAASYYFNNGLLLKMATGRYYQFLNKTASEQHYGYNRDFWILADGNDNPVVSSNHFILGAAFETKKFLFDVEAYYKATTGIQEYLFFSDPEKKIQELPTQNPYLIQRNLSRFFEGKGKAYGIDFLAKYSSTNYTSWIAYSISKSTRNFDIINYGNDIPSMFDQTHEFKWTNIYKFNNWTFSLLSLFTTGHPYISSASKDENFNTIRTYKRLPNYFRIDVSANYKIKLKKVQLTPGLSILNAMNNENYLDAYYRKFSFRDGEFKETTLVKAQDLTLNFFLNFRF